MHSCQDHFELVSQITRCRISQWSASVCVRICTTSLTGRPLRIDIYDDIIILLSYGRFCSHVPDTGKCCMFWICLQPSTLSIVISQFEQYCPNQQHMLTYIIFTLSLKSSVRKSFVSCSLHIIFEAHL